MRPRSRLLSKRRLTLPTIKEGSEEAVRELNETNTLHNHNNAVSSEDYLLSICHLAHPTFANRDISTCSGVTSEFNLETEKGKDLVFGNSDPLEYLYGNHGGSSVLSGGGRKGFAEEGFVRQRGRGWESQIRTRAHSIPRSSSPDFPRQRKSSCPELHAHTSVPNVYPSHSSPRPEARRRSSPVEKRAGGDNPAIKQSLLSQWINDCRTAWRETRLRACMLPAIAEV